MKLSVHAYSMLMAASYAWGQAQLTYKDCGGSGKINELIATPCTQEPCEFKKGTTVHYTINITPSTDSDSATLDATVSVLGLQVPLPNVNRNLCDQGPCPLQAGVPAVFNIDIPLGPSPQSKTTLTMKVSGNDGLEGCAKVPIFFS
ncbi:immunoglobulin E-set [Aspergillus unguis]